MMFESALEHAVHMTVRALSKFASVRRSLRKMRFSSRNWSRLKWEGGLVDGEEEELVASLFAAFRKWVILGDICAPRCSRT